ncbi:MAG TPA: hypothetical protein VF501_01265, partial [Thiobacillus sp.]
MHPAAARRFLYFLLVTLLINAGGWTFNREAVADALFAGHQSVPAEAAAQSVQTPRHHGELPGKAHCNHWCHAEGHLLGLFGQMPGVSSECVATLSPQISRFIPEPDFEGLFRPPRLLS